MSEPRHHRGILGPDRPTMARWHNNLVVLWQLGHLAGARAQCERTLTIEGAVLGAGSSKAGAGHRPQQHQSYRQELGDHSVQRI